MKKQIIYNVLFLCTGNSARSIMAEALLARWGQGKFRAYSAGSFPKGYVHPVTLEVLRKQNFKTDAFYSKSRDEFTRPGTPQLDFVFTVCDRAARETCPVWPGQPMTAHWGIADPVREYPDAEQEYRGFYRTYLELETRIKLFTSLPISGLDRLTLQKRLDDIGKIQTEENSGKIAS
jgi:protein-tyrosine-phosphatase